VDHVIWQLQNDPASRRIMTSMYNFQDLHEMALAPCAYSMTFNVKGNKLNAILNQRSQDMLTANNCYHYFKRCTFLVRDKWYSFQNNDKTKGVRVAA
jgi:thymidylate synthase